MKDSGTNWAGLEGLLRRLEDLSRQSVTVGVHDTAGRIVHPSSHSGGYTVAQVAAANEFGSDGVPSRPFLRRCAGLYKTGFGRGKPRRAVRKRIAGLFQDKETPVGVATEMSKVYKNLVLESLESAKEWATPLHPTTIALKGHDLPLYDTGTLTRAIDAQRRTKG